MLYLDYAATTPPYDEVVDAIAEVMRTYYGNPSSLHRLGVEAERLLHQAKEVIARTLRVKPNEIIFTSGGTESNNLAIKGTAYAYSNRGRRLITTQVEHSSVMEPFRQLEREGFDVTYLRVDHTGMVQLDALRAALDQDVILVSVMHVNNEMGRIQPLAEIGRLLDQYPKTLFHVDAVQGVGKLPLEPSMLGIDLLTASAHKFRGPKGVGFLYKRETIRLQPQIVGGGQEGGMRSGTENVPLIVGMAKALRMSADHLTETIRHKYRLRSLLCSGISSIPELKLTGSANEIDMAPHIVHFCFPGMKAEVVVHALEQRGMYISTKSACSSDELKPSEVLLAMGYEHHLAGSGLRISFSEDQTEADMLNFIDALREVVQELKATAKTRGGRH